MSSLDDWEKEWEQKTQKQKAESRNCWRWIFRHAMWAPVMPGVSWRSAPWREGEGRDRECMIPLTDHFTIVRPTLSRPKCVIV